MRAACVFVALLALAACASSVSAQPTGPIVPQDPDVSSGRQQFYLQMSSIASASNINASFGTFGGFTQVSEYLDASFYQSTYTQVIDGNAVTRVLPRANGTSGAVFTNTTADILGARATSPLSPRFPLNNILAEDFPVERNQTALYEAILGVRADGTAVRDAQGKARAPARLPRITNDFNELIGLTSFTPRSDFASTTFGELVWVLGGADASYIPGQAPIPSPLNDVHISLDSGNTWAQLYDGETDSTLSTPLHWSPRRGTVAVAYKFEGPYLNGKPAYRAPCPSRTFTPQGQSATPTQGANAYWGPAPSTLPGCELISGQTVGLDQTNFIRVRNDSAGLVEFGAAYTGGAATVGAVPYPSGKAQPIVAGTALAKAAGISSGYIAILMTSGRAGLLKRLSPISDAWLSLDFGVSFTLQCYTNDGTATIPSGPAGSSIVPNNNDNNNSMDEYNDNLNPTYFATSPSLNPDGPEPAGFFPAGVASCGFKARFQHTMVAIPGVGCDGNTCTVYPSALVMGGASTDDGALNDVWRTHDNGQTWIQVNGCDYANFAINPQTGNPINEPCVANIAGVFPSSAQSVKATQVFDADGNLDNFFEVEAIWQSRSQFAATVVTVTGPGTNAGNSNNPVAAEGFTSFQRVIVLGGSATSELSDVWASDDVFVKPGVQAALANFIVCGEDATADSPANPLPAGTKIEFSRTCRGPADANIPTRPATDAQGSAIDNGVTRVTLYAPYEYNLLPKWTQYTQASVWLPRRGHAVAFLACLGQLFLTGGASVGARLNDQDTTSIASLNDVWYSSDSGFSWKLLAANNQTGGFPRRDLFGMVTSSSALIVMGGQIQDVNGPKIAVALPASVNNGVPVYGDVWSSTFAQYTYGPYGPCQCNKAQTGFGFQARAYACASGSPNTQGCCQGTPITQTRCSCYTWTAPYFTTNLLAPNADGSPAGTPGPANTLIVPYSPANVIAQCQADTECDTYNQPRPTFLYASADCYDQTGYNLKNYTISATPATYDNGGFNPADYNAPGANGNTRSFPVAVSNAPDTDYVYQSNGLTAGTYVDTRDNPCDGYFKTGLVNGGTAGGVAKSTLVDAIFDAVSVDDDARAQTTVAYGAASLATYEDLVSKDDYVYNNLGLARAYYLNSAELETYERTYLTDAQASYNLYNGFYFTPQPQPQLLFPCNRPLCRTCVYSQPKYEDVCLGFVLGGGSQEQPITCGVGNSDLIQTGADAVYCLDITFGVTDGTPNSAPNSFTRLPDVLVGQGSGLYATFGAETARSCCTQNFDPNFINLATGQTTDPFTPAELAAAGGVNPYRRANSSAGALDYAFINVDYPDLRIPCSRPECPRHVLGDPEFLGFQGQKYEIHGIPDQIFAIISSPLVQYNARFVYLGHASKHQCDKTRTHPWTHAGTYLGELGFKTAGGDEIVLQSGICTKGIKSVTVNGKPLRVGHKVSLKHQVPLSGVHQSIAMTDAFNVVLQLAEFDITLTNSDNFFNQEVSMTAYGEEMLASHGLLGQTWKNETYIVDGVKRVIEGIPTDYLIADEDILGNSFAFNKFNL